MRNLFAPHPAVTRGGAKTALTPAITSTAFLLAFAVTVAACTGPADGPGVSPSAAEGPPSASLVTASCRDAAPAWRPLGLPGIDAAVEEAPGPTVVFLNDSTNSACAWLPLADKLGKAGRQVVVFSYRDTDPQSESQDVSDAIAVADRARGAQPYALVGASIGGRVAIRTAAQHPSGLKAIAVLSGERLLDGEDDILPDARQVEVAALYVGAEDDPYTHGRTQQRQLHQAMRGKPNLFLQRSGTNHGVNLLNADAGDGEVVTPIVIDYLVKQTQ